MLCSAQNSLYCANTIIVGDLCYAAHSYAPHACDSPRKAAFVDTRVLWNCARELLEWAVLLALDMRLSLLFVCVYRSFPRALTFTAHQRVPARLLLSFIPRNFAGFLACARLCFCLCSCLFSAHDSRLASRFFRASLSSSLLLCSPLCLLLCSRVFASPQSLTRRVWL